MMTTDRRRLTPEQKNYKNWPQIDLESLQPEVRAWVENRRNMIFRYLDGEKVNDVCFEHHYSRKELHKILAKCLSFHNDGRIFGERGFLQGEGRKPYTRVANVANNQKNGYTGAFKQLLERHPRIRQMIHDSVMNRKQKGEINEPRIPIGTALYQKVRNALLNEGLKGGDYPFNTSDQGRRSLYNYVDKLFDSYPRQMIKARHGKESSRRYGSGHIDQRPPTVRPLARVQMDTHIFDEIDTVLIEHPWGGFTEVPIERCCAPFIMDEASRAILGFSVALSKKPSQEDILACIEDALTPWEPLELTIPGLRYPEPSYGYSPAMVGAQWDATLFDNEWANLAYSVTDTLMDVVGCDVNAGTVRAMNDRAIIERFFRTYTDRYVKRKANTTGGHPKDTLRNHPEQKALKYSMRLDHMLQILHVAIYEYNTTKHAGLGARTPYQVLGMHCENPRNLVRRIEPGDEHLLDKLAIRVTRKVQGSLKRGTRPYVEFMGARYKNDILVDLPDLIGQEITLIVKPKKDIRQIKAFGPRGRSLGTLHVTGPWRRSSHTFKIRQQALWLINHKHIKCDGRSDPIQAMKEFYAKRAVRNKQAATKHAAIQQVKKSTDMKTSVGPDVIRQPGKQETSQKPLPVKRIENKPGFVE